MNKLTTEQRKEQIENLTQFLDFLEIKQPDRDYIKKDIVTAFLSETFYDESPPVQTIVQSEMNPKDIYAKLSIKKTVGVTTKEQVQRYAIFIIKFIKDKYDNSFILFIRNLRSLPLKNRIVLLRKKKKEFERLDFVRNEITKDLDNFDWIIGYYNTTIEELEQAEKTLEAEELLDEMGLSETSNLPKYEIFNFNSSENEEGKPDIETEYAYEDDFFFKRIYKPIVEIDKQSLTSIFEIDIEEFESFYFEKLPHFEKKFDATEIDFAKEYLEYLDDILNAPQYIPNGTESENLQKFWSPLLFDISFAKFNLIKKLGERRFEYSTNKKINFIRNRIKHCESNLEINTDSNISENKKENYKTSSENRFFKIAQRFNVDTVPSNKAHQNLLFDSHINEATIDFINEITENVSNSNIDNKLFYLKRIKARLTHSLEVNFKYYDPDLNQLFLKQRKVLEKPDFFLNDDFPEIQKEYLYSLVNNRTKIFNYITFCKAGITNKENDKLKNSPSKDIQSKDSDILGTSLECLLNEEKVSFLNELLENLNITKDGKYILGEKRKGAILGIAEALLENYIVPEISKTILCKIIAKQINLNIGPKLNTSTTSNKYKKEATNYIKTNYIH